MRKKKKAGESYIIMTELVLPHHTNQLGNLLGGQLMHWIDICAALSAAKHSQRVCVTASVDRIDFHHPIKLGDAVMLQLTGFTIHRWKSVLRYLHSLSKKV